MVAAWLMLVPREASACICAWWGKPNADAIMAEAKASVPNIFEGKVLEVRSSPLSDRTSIPQRVSRVKVTRVTKGQLAVGAVVEVKTGEDTCEVRLSPGADYVVHATESMGTSVCMETRRLTPEPAYHGPSERCQKSMDEKLDVALPSYDAVFEGPVNSWRSSDPAMTEVSLTVERVWKGKLRAGESVTVQTEGFGTSVSGRMLVLARKKNGALVATCSPSRLFFNDRDALLTELGPPPDVPPGSRCGACTVGRASEGAPGVVGLGLVLGGLAWRRSRRRGWNPDRAVPHRGAARKTRSVRADPHRGAARKTRRVRPG